MAERKKSTIKALALTGQGRPKPPLGGGRASSSWAALMRFHFPRSRASAGYTSVMAALMMAGIFGVVLLAYMDLTQWHQQSNARQQAREAALAVAEAGIAEARALLRGKSGAEITGEPGWAKDGARYRLQRSLGDDYFVVTISNYVPGVNFTNPVIESSGYVSASAGPGSNYVSRSVRVVAQLRYRFPKAVVAHQGIALFGCWEFDSYDSSDEHFSDGGHYRPNKAKDGADLAFNNRIEQVAHYLACYDTFADLPPKVRGHLNASPDDSVTLSDGAALGSEHWVKHHEGIQADWRVAEDWNVDYRSVGVPFDHGFAIPAKESYTYDHTNRYGYLLSGGNYKLSTTMNLTGETMVVTANTKLYLEEGAYLCGAEVIVANHASLDIYCGQSFYTYGSALNVDGQTSQLTLYGLGGNSGFDCYFVMLSCSDWVGGVYAPDSMLVLHDLWARAQFFTGACNVDQLVGYGHGDGPLTHGFHYDEAMARSGATDGYAIRSWQEISGP
jgi:hypothetical protein